MEMYNPPHPGEILLELYIKPLELTITEVAEGLGVSRPTLSDLVNKHRSVSTDMAERLAIAFDTDPRTWLNLQLQYDLWIHKKHASEIQICLF